MGLYPVALCYNARQDNTIPYSTIQYKTVTHITQDNIYAELQKIKNSYYTLLRLRNE
jgi:hypothetical protein